MYERSCRSTGDLMNDGDFPSLDDIDQDLDRFADGHSDIAHIESLGLSAEGRDVKAVYVTDNSIPATEKEVAVVVCGRHGSELGTRVVGTALLDWLSSAEGEETRRRQLVIVVPVANPDGCMREEFWAPGDGLSETEENTIAALARAYQPDAVMDVHSWGGVLDGEAIVTANTSDSGEDAFIHRALGTKMVEEAARQGYPFLLHSVRLPDGYNNFFCGMCYGHFHSLVFGMEVNHSFLKPEETVESGMAIIKTLLNEGNTRSPWEPHVGYPNRILLGDFFTAIRSTGSNAAERRTSRSEIWRNRKCFTVPQREFLAPHTIRVATEYAGASLSGGYALVCRIRGSPDFKTIRLNGKDVEATTYEDNCSTYVCVDIHPSGKEQYELSIGLCPTTAK